MAGHLADESLETAIVECPLFDFGDPFQGHVERARGAPMLVSQVPAWLRAAGPLEGTEAAFEEGAQLSDLAQGGLARPRVAVGMNRVGVHEWVAVRSEEDRYRSEGSFHGASLKAWATNWWICFSSARKLAMRCWHSRAWAGERVLVVRLPFKKPIQR